MWVFTFITVVMVFSMDGGPTDGRSLKGDSRREKKEELKKWRGQKEKTMSYSDVRVDQYNDLFYDKQKIEKF